MKSIEERAKINATKAIEYACGRREGDTDYITNLFIQMATEQRVIMEAELTEVKRQRDAYYDELLKLRRQKVEFIEKACKAFCKTHGCGIPHSTCTSLGTCDEYDSFNKELTKSMEK